MDNRPIILTSGQASPEMRDLASALVGYLSMTHSLARERHVRVDTVHDRVFVVMDPLEDDEALAYGFIRGALDAYVAAWNTAMTAVNSRQRQGRLST